MQRQLAASGIEIHTEDGWASFVLPDPVHLDFKKVGEVLDSANYTLHRIELEARGTVANGIAGTVFELPGTGQVLPISGVGTAGVIDLRAEVLGWRGIEPRLRVKSQ